MLRDSQLGHHQQLQYFTVHHHIFLFASYHHHSPSPLRPRSEPPRRDLLTRANLAPGVVSHRLSHTTPTPPATTTSRAVACVSGLFRRRHPVSGAAVRREIRLQPSRVESQFPAEVSLKWAAAVASRRSSSLAFRHTGPSIAQKSNMPRRAGRPPPFRSLSLSMLLCTMYPPQEKREREREREREHHTTTLSFASPGGGHTRCLSSPCRPYEPRCPRVVFFRSLSFLSRPVQLLFFLYAPPPAAAPGIPHRTAS
jgi:hypothetical protein